MRPAGRAALAALAVLAAAQLEASPRAAAHPAHSIEPVTVRTAEYDPATVTIRENSSVQWTWDTAVPHSVTFGPRFDSGMRTSGDPPYDRRFRNPGTYEYRSEGTTEITGTVVVEPYPGVAPRIRRLRVVNRSDPKARFRLNKRADLVARIKRRAGGGWRTAKTFSRVAPRGPNRINLPDKGLDPGRYRLDLKAYDFFGRRDSARDRFRLR